MHVLHVLNELKIGGMERLAVALANATVEKEHRATLCVTRSDATMADERDPGVQLEIIARSWRFDPIGARRFARLVGSADVDVLHVHNLASFLFICYAKTIAWLPVPIVYHQHSSRQAENPSTRRWFRYFGRRWIDAYVGVHDQSTAWGRAAGIPPARVHQISNAVACRRFANAERIDLHAAYAIAADRKVGVLVGNLKPVKGVDVLIEALADSPLAERVCVLVVGLDADAHYAEQCRRRCARHGLREAIRFVGPHRDVPGILRGADFGLGAARSESGPLNLIEYVASGLPFVATLTGDVAHRLHAAGVPEFVPIDDPNALREAVGRVIGLSRAQRRERVVTGREFVLRNFDMESVLPRWCEAYELAAASFRSR